MQQMAPRFKATFADPPKNAGWLPGSRFAAKRCPRAQVSGTGIRNYAFSTLYLSPALILVEASPRIRQAIASPQTDHARVTSSLDHPRRRCRYADSDDPCRGWGEPFRHTPAPASWISSRDDSRLSGGIARPRHHRVLPRGPVLEHLRSPRPVAFPSVRYC